MPSSFEIARDQLQNSNVDIKQHPKVFRWIVAIGKTLWLASLVVLVIITLDLFIVFIFARAYLQSIILIVIFLVLMSIMNRLVDYYGD
jgi:hypothetical protein